MLGKMLSDLGELDCQVGHIQFNGVRYCMNDDAGSAEAGGGVMLMRDIRSLAALLSLNAAEERESGSQPPREET
jgi:hypothetical protein